jgi:hypothetical protein
MPIQLKRSLTSGSLPTTASLVPGELALNVPDGRIFLRKSGSGSDTIQSAITTGAQNSGSVALTGSLSLYSATGSVLDVSGDVVSIDGDIIEIAADTMEFTGSFVNSGSLRVVGPSIFSGSISVSGSVNVFSDEFLVQSTGVKIGNIITDRHTMTGSLAVSGSITGSLFGTSSWATNVVNAPNPFPLSGSAVITGSISLTGSLSVSGSTVLFVAQNISPTGSISSSYFTISGSVRQPPTVGSRSTFVDITPTIGYTTSSQVNTAFRVNATFSGSSAFTSSQNNIIADFGATSAGSQLTITDVTSGSIYMVNDVSGFPIIEANSNWDVFIYDFPNVVFKKSASFLELGINNNLTSSVTVKSDLILNEGYGITHRTLQVSSSTSGNVTSSLYNLPFTNVSSSVFLTAIVTGYDTGSRDTISGEIKGTIRYRAGVASIVGSNYSYLNSDNVAVGFSLVAGSTSGSILVYGTGSREYQWGATVTTQII